MASQRICTATAMRTGEQCRQPISRLSAERCRSHLDADERAVRDRLAAEERAARQAREDLEEAARRHLRGYLRRAAREAWDRADTRADAIRRVMWMLVFERRTRGKDILEVEHGPPSEASEHQCPSVTLIIWDTSPSYCQLAAFHSYLGHPPDRHYAPGHWDVAWDDSDAFPLKAPSRP